MLRAVSKFLLEVSGWRFVGDPPPTPSVCVGFPHSSYWDGLLLVLLAKKINLRMRWMVKDSVVRPPFKRFLLDLGAVPIERSASHNVVEQMVQKFAEDKEMFLLIPPEGTRGLTAYWKSGFYYIALQAKVPITLSFLDWGRKEGGFGPSFMPTGNVKEDMDRIRAYYAEKDPQANHQEKVGPIRLREELEGQEALRKAG